MAEGDKDLKNSVAGEGEMTRQEEDRLLQEALLEGSKDYELAEQVAAGLKKLKPTIDNAGEKIGLKVMQALADIGILDLEKSGKPIVRIDVTGRISISGRLGKIRGDGQPLPLAQLKDALGIQSLNFDTGVNSFLVEFSLADYRDARRKQEGFTDPMVGKVAGEVKEAASGAIS